MTGVLPAMQHLTGCYQQQIVSDRVIYFRRQKVLQNYRNRWWSGTFFDFLSKVWAKYFWSLPGADANIFLNEKRISRETTQSVRRGY